MQQSQAVLKALLTPMGRVCTLLMKATSVLRSVGLVKALQSAPYARRLATNAALKSVFYAKTLQLLLKGKTAHATLASMTETSPLVRAVCPVVLSA
jgi:hypothetical protein